LREFVRELQYIDLLDIKIALMKINFAPPLFSSRRVRRRLNFAALALFGAAVAILVAPSPAEIPAANKVVDSDGTGAYSTGHYRDVFAELGHSENEVAAKIETAYQELFHGDPQTQAVYFASGRNGNGPLAYLTDWANHDARTEGMSYGMMISVQLNHKPEFDALWNWARTYMYISDPHHPSYGYFSWSCKIDGTPNEETAAPDGEEYFVMALYFASARWGNGTGIYDYKAQADALLTTMRHRAVMTGPTRFGQRTVGNEVDESHRMIRFVPGVDRGDFTDPSYHLPAFYELWARWGPVEDRQFWAEAAEASREFFPKTTNLETGLAPDYANFDGTPRETRFKQSSIFGYDSWRTASNWSVDWAWWGKAPQERVLSDRIQSFFVKQGLEVYGDQYALNGEKVANRHSTGLVATNAVATLAATNPQSKEFVRILWNTPVPSGEQRYYDGMLYIMSMMHLSGQFRIWTPK
jgi:oligosaccharide reducing-end xylanase